VSWNWGQRKKNLLINGLGAKVNRQEGGTAKWKGEERRRRIRETIEDAPLLCSEGKANNFPKGKGGSALLAACGKKKKRQHSRGKESSTPTRQCLETIERAATHPDKKGGKRGRFVSSRVKRHSLAWQRDGDQFQENRHNVLIINLGLYNSRGGKNKSGADPKRKKT